MSQKLISIFKKLFSNNEYSVCRQSPIDIVYDETKINLGNIGLLKVNYTNIRCKKTDENLASIYKFVPNDNSYTIIYNGHKHTLKNIHIHMSSEHTLNGTSFDAEVHFVHTSDDGSHNVVLGMFITFVEEDNMSFFNVNEDYNFQIDIKNMNYFNYAGSLTTPPYNTNVSWIVFEKPLLVKRPTFNYETNRKVQKTIHPSELKYMKY